MSNILNQNNNNRNTWLVDRWYQKTAYVLGWIQLVFLAIYLFVAIIAICVAIQQGY